MELWARPIPGAVFFQAAASLSSRQLSAKGVHCVPWEPASWRQLAELSQASEAGVEEEADATERVAEGGPEGGLEEGSVEEGYEEEFDESQLEEEFIEDDDDADWGLM